MTPDAPAADFGSLPGRFFILRRAASLARLSAVDAKGDVLPQGWLLFDRESKCCQAHLNSPLLSLKIMF
jgi:hypothetical protein